MPSLSSVLCARSALPLSTLRSRLSAVSGASSLSALSIAQPRLLTNRAFSTNQRDSSGLQSRLCAVLGAQWGDEGKGKLVDCLARRYDIVARFNGGSNAGHTLVVNGAKFAFHLLPCGMLYEGKVNVVGNGVVVHVPTLMEELHKLKEAGVDTAGRLKISNRAHLLFDFHQAVDGQLETELQALNIGTTRKGIGPCYSSKANRNGVRVGELLDFAKFEQKYNTLARWMQQRYGVQPDTATELARYKDYAAALKPMIADTVYFLNDQYRNGKTILAEGANAALLDLDFGTYPYVTSSSTTGGGVCTGLGLAPTLIDTALGVVKAYTTRVGAGPFPTELKDQVGAKLREIGREFGTTTGRPRRCGWLDIPVVRYAHALNNFQGINITKLDVLSDFDELLIGVTYKLNGQRLPYGQMPSRLEELAAVEVEYEKLPGWKCDISKCRTMSDLPRNAQAYLKRVESLLEVPISWIGVGPGRLDMVTQGFKFSA